MSWFIDISEKPVFERFFKDRCRDVGEINPHIEANIKTACWLVLSNSATSNTCERVCGTYGCTEKTSDHCQITTNSKDKFDPTDWRRVHRWQMIGITKYRDDIVKIVGEKRLSYFIANLTDLAIDEIDSMWGKNKAEWVSKHGTPAPVEIEPVTISDLANDPWTQYVSRSNKPEKDHLLCLET